VLDIDGKFIDNGFGMSNIKTKEEIALITEGGRRMGEILAELEKMIKPGVSAWEIDQEAEKLIHKAGGKPAFKGYQPRSSDTPFPGTVCVCINDELVHGIPTKEKVIRAGDIVSLDIGMEWPSQTTDYRLQTTDTRQKSVVRSPKSDSQHKGYFTDTALTVAVGEVKDEARRLLEVTKQALEIGMAQCKPVNTIADIGRAIETYVRAQGNYGIVRDLVGHGVGHKPHEAPAVPNYYSRELEGWKLEPGVVIAIEPMITLGGHEITTDPDRWTIRTQDRSLCAHFEHTIIITGDKPIVATRRSNE